MSSFNGDHYDPEFTSTSPGAGVILQRLLSITLITIAAHHVRSQDRPPPCGGRLKGPHGIIQTPNFPQAFPVPIRCRWVIEHDIPNGTILVYFTQQYTTSGLTFTEYVYYDDTYQLGERRALAVTDENVTQVKWLQRRKTLTDYQNPLQPACQVWRVWQNLSFEGGPCPAVDELQVQSPVLVVELALDRLEGTQLRALGLLAVFGFNVTYAVRAPGPGPPSCSAVECRLLGHCYASRDYQEFFCACFEGYSGADCGAGPLCARAARACRNGGTCRQLGQAAVSCVCAPGYTGDLCEAEIAEPECGIEECSEACGGRACECSPRDSDSFSARFETRLQVMDQGDVNISQEAVKLLTNYLKASNITLEDKIEILNISSPEGGARTVRVRIWGARAEVGAVRAALARLVESPPRAAHHLRLLPASAPLHFGMHPALMLHPLIVNQRSEVWEDSEFILSCMAHGSPDLAFTWYKDGVKVNFNGTSRDMWSRVVSEDALGRRMAVLGVAAAARLDSGRWACVARDAGRARCSALRLTVLQPPDIRLVPSSVTLKKGDNASMRCLASAGRAHGALGFSWARERALLPLEPRRAVWEDLLPAGSLLTLYNVQKSAEYHCQVSSVGGTSSKGVAVWVLGPGDEACAGEASHGLRWPQTPPGARAAADCPPGYSGETTRFCEPKTGQHGVKWMPPDFVNCVPDSLNDVFEQFTLISYGYSWGSVWQACAQYAAVLRALPALPGAAALPLRHAQEMLQYLRSPAGRASDRGDSVQYLLEIFDHLLKHPDAFLDEEKIYELQKLVVETAGMRDDVDLQTHQLGVMSQPVRASRTAHFTLPAIASAAGEWHPESVTLELAPSAGTGSATAVVVLYHNLADRLPSLRRSIEFNEPSSKRGRELRLSAASPQVQVWAGAGVGPAAPHTVTLLFAHSKNYSAVESNLACRVRTESEPRTWVRAACEVRVPQPARAVCRCRALGTFALFTLDRASLIEAERDLRGMVKITVSVGSTMCLAAAALQLLSVAPARAARLPVLLKAATAGAHAAAVLALLQCDTRQEVACPGVLGWLCATCWCAGDAALCAQPLILQAELAGRVQRAPSVGLLAGVCILSWLSARLWGGAPLQLGSAAQIVCAAGCALLAALCLALAACASSQLRTIIHKVPAERRNYLRDRRRVVRHTLVLLGTTCACQAAGVAYAQPGARTAAAAAALAAAALANGLAMVICYIIKDGECLRVVQKMLSSSSEEWRESPAVGDTSLSLYIKQGGEVESRGGAMFDSSSSAASPVTSYWRAHALESPARLQRQSTPDCRADIIRCVEYKESAMAPHRYESRHLTTQEVCDLIPHPAPQPEYTARAHLEPVVQRSPPRHSPAPVFLSSRASDIPSCDERFDTPRETCPLCVQSNPDVSKIPSAPIKSCLKKSINEFSTSISLPSMEVINDEPKPKSDIDMVNREWQKAYNSPDTDKMLNKISNDLDFLLNRTLEAKKVINKIAEAPT